METQSQWIAVLLTRPAQDGAVTVWESAPLRRGEPAERGRGTRYSTKAGAIRAARRAAAERAGASWRVEQI